MSRSLGSSEFPFPFCESRWGHLSHEVGGNTNQLPGVQFPACGKVKTRSCDHSLLWPRLPWLSGLLFHLCNGRAEPGAPPPPDREHSTFSAVPAVGYRGQSSGLSLEVGSRGHFLTKHWDGEPQGHRPRAQSSEGPCVHAHRRTGTDKHGGFPNTHTAEHPVS